MEDLILKKLEVLEVDIGMQDDSAEPERWKGLRNLQTLKLDGTPNWVQSISLQIIVPDSGGSNSLPRTSSVSA